MDYRLLLEWVIPDGFGQLIDRFNSLDPDDSSMDIMPGAKNLKKVLLGKPLPTFEEIGPKDWLYDIKRAAKLMQSEEEIENKGIPETNDLSLIIEIAAHIVERSIFSYMRRKGIAAGHNWQENEVLFALEDIVLLRHAECETHRGHESLLFTRFNSPRSLGGGGGLGWKDPEYIDKFIRDYKILTNFQEQ